MREKLQGSMRWLMSGAMMCLFGVAVKVFAVAAFFNFRCPAEGCPSCPACKMMGK